MPHAFHKVCSVCMSVPKHSSPFGPHKIPWTVVPCPTLFDILQHTCIIRIFDFQPSYTLLKLSSVNASNIEHIPLYKSLQSASGTLGNKWSTHTLFYGINTIAIDILFRFHQLLGSQHQMSSWIALIIAILDVLSLSITMAFGRIVSMF